MSFRVLCFYIIYLIVKVKYCRIVKFNGFTVFVADKSSAININGNGIVINSHPLSNLLGLYQRTHIVARHGGQINIGSSVGISGSTIFAMERIDIGNNVQIGANCKIIDNDFHSLRAEKRLNQKVDDIRKKPVLIGDDCFIGTQSIILKGTVLGKNCVVGAGSVVSGQFPDNVIIAGNPAKVIKENK